MKRKFLLFLPSTWACIKEGYHIKGLSFANMLHAYIYSKWIYLYISIASGEHFIARRFKSGPSFLYHLFKPSKENTSNGKCITFADTYHGKVLSLDSGKQLVTLNKNIKINDLEKVIPYNLARSIIIKNPDYIVLMDCPCRSAQSKPCNPIDVCLIIGEPFCSFVMEHHPGRCRKISQKDAVDILVSEHRRGHVHHAFFKSDLGGRFYAICNCCSCCCAAIKAWNNGTPMLASSGYVSRIDPVKCISCGVCAAFCQFGALKKENDTMVIDESRCLGCGICVTKCTEKARWLESDPSRGEPLEINKLVARQQLDQNC